MGSPAPALSSKQESSIPLLSVPSVTPPQRFRRAASLPAMPAVNGWSAGSSIDGWLVAGILVALTATVAGIAFTGVSLVYFFQPTAACLVLGGTLGVALITTPRDALLHAVRRAGSLLRPQNPRREALIEEIMTCAKIRRKEGIFGLKPLLEPARREQMSNTFLREVLALVMDTPNRHELQTALETKLRLSDRQSEADAHVLEVTGGFAPTIGVLGTVVGLIDILHQFSNPAKIAVGIGTAFVSTIYGLSLANLLLLPAACRIRASAAEKNDLDEMIAEAGMALFDGLHPALLQERLNDYLGPRGGVI